MAFRFAARRLRASLSRLWLCRLSLASAPRMHRSCAQPSSSSLRRRRGAGVKLRQATGPEGRGRARQRRHAASTPPAAEQHRLPPDSTTKQTLALPGRTLRFTATAGSIRLFDDKGEPQADIAYTSYQLDGADRAHAAP